MNLRTRVVVIVAVATVFTGCIASQNTAMESVDMRSWNEPIRLTYDNADTLSLRNIRVAIRYNADFDMAVLPLKVGVTTPNMQYFEEIVELRLPLYSTALTLAVTESLPYRNVVVLNQKGNYTFAFEPLSEIQGVEAIGVEFTDK